MRKVAILAAPWRELIRKSKTKKAVGCELVLQASCRSLRMLGALSSSLWAFGRQDPLCSASCRNTDLLSGLGNGFLLTV